MLCKGGGGATEGQTEEFKVDLRAADWRSQSRFFQVVEVWHTRPGGASEAVPILAPLDAHLLWVRVAFRAAQGRRVPARLQLSRQRVA